MASPGTMLCGSRSQRSIFSGLFGSRPAMTVRAPILSSGGPTSPWAPSARSAWHAPQPSRVNSRPPRRDPPPRSGSWRQRSAETWRHRDQRDQIENRGDEETEPREAAPPREKLGAAFDPHRDFDAARNRFREAIVAQRCNARRGGEHDADEIDQQQRPPETNPCAVEQRRAVGITGMTGDGIDHEKLRDPGERAERQRGQENRHADTAAITRRRRDMGFAD